MTPEKLNELILQGEGIEVEFKTSRFELSKDTFETICAFLNRKGGHLLLGMKDNGTVEGIMGSNAFPAKLIIEKDKVYAENWNRPHGSGAIDPANFSPYPKNPVIARFFKEIGRVDELGSGIRNTFKYCGIYTPGTKPEFIEGDVFKTIIPLKAEKVIIASDWKEVRKRLGDQLGDRLGDSEWKILEIIWSNPTASITEMAESIEISTTAIEKNIKKLKEKGILERVGSTKKGYWEMKGV